jgi:tRNA A37 threonylcarbamoyladenosine dehydratase
MHAFAGKRVVIWGCGALGAPIAESIVRAGASAVILCDSASVHPGVLILQPFIDDDLGRAKAVVLAHRLERSSPRHRRGRGA